MLVKKGQDNKIINLHDKTVIYTSRFVYIHQDSCIYSKIRVYTSRFVYIHLDSCSSDIKESKTAGSIIVFSNGDRKMAASEEATSSLLRRVYRAMTEEMTPANNVEEELSRVFFFLFFFCVGAQKPSLQGPKLTFLVRRQLAT